MKQTVAGVCEYLKSTPPIDELQAAHKAFLKKRSIAEQTGKVDEFEAIEQILRSAISDLESGDAIGSFRVIAERHQERTEGASATTVAPTENGDEPALDSTPLIPDGTPERLPRALKQKRFEELKAQFGQRAGGISTLRARSQDHREAGASPPTPVNSEAAVALAGR